MPRQTFDHAIRPNLMGYRGLVFGTLLVAASLGATGCQSNPESDASPTCKPRSGMTTDQLFACKCFPANGGGNVALDAQQTAAVQSVIILNYLCPRRGGRMSHILVVNGVVKDVYD